MSGRGKLFAALQQVYNENLERGSNANSLISENNSIKSHHPSISSTPSIGRGLLLMNINRSVGASTSFSHSDFSEQLDGSVTVDDLKNKNTATTAPQPLPAKESGVGGTPAKVATNYIRMKCKSSVIMHEYYVSFEPDIHSTMIRKKMLNRLRERIGMVKTFDGTILFLPHKLPNPITKVNELNDDKRVEITIKYQGDRSMSDCIHFFNLLFKQIMRTLDYIQFGKKLFNPKDPKIIPQHRLTIWPGYVTAVDEYDGGLMLMLDVSHRVLCNTTIHDLMVRIHANKNQDFRSTFLKSVIGSIVLAKHSNKTYTIDDVDFDKCPTDTFETNKGPITYVEYYKAHYGIDIQDLKQPLLISYKDRKYLSNNRFENDVLTIALIPELSCLTGLTDEMRSDNKVMRDIASIARVSPNQRIDAMRKFIDNVKKTKDARALLDGWGLELDENLVELQARILGPESIRIGQGRSVPNVVGNFIFGAKDQYLETVDILNWILIYTQRDQRTKQEFHNLVHLCAGPMGVQIRDPIEVRLPDDRNESYAGALRKNLKHDTQIVVLICPTSRDDRYSVIKKICCAENPVASQVINSRTLCNQKNSRSIVQKILMQMNCKLGGSLWSIGIPFKKVMICGIDTYHDKKSKSVSAFVASLNESYTRWYSKATIQHNREELSHGLQISVKNALEAYRKMNGFNPERIIIYRDGVGDSQFQTVKEYEIPQIKRAFELFEKNFTPKISHIVVQKRVNTRIFKMASNNHDYSNPDPGTIVDHTITRRNLFDFYLVSQKMRDGTATPTHYVIVENECKLSADILQRLTYKLTYQYFNWTGSIRVPAPCQYAHKLAYLVGESIQRETADKLSDKLFYL